MKGWKTWAAIVLAAVTAGLEAGGMSEYAKVVGTVAGAFGIWGIGHKIEKAVGGK